MWRTGTLSVSKTDGRLSPNSMAGRVGGEDGGLHPGEILLGRRGGGATGLLELLSRVQAQCRGVGSGSRSFVEPIVPCPAILHGIGLGYIPVDAAALRVRIYPAELAQLCQVHPVSLA